MRRIDTVRENFQNALRSLNDAVTQAKTDLENDGVIQRFEFTCELFWKLLKIHLENEGIVAHTPKECFRQAYRIGLLGEEERFVRMVEDRNLSVHLYNQRASREVIGRIKDIHIRSVNETLDKLKEG